MINFMKQEGLIPVIIQDDTSDLVCMLGYMNQQAYEKTRSIGFVYFWSRSKQRLWLKGEQSGNYLRVKALFLDCDADCLLIRVQRVGRFVCHKGKQSCFQLLKKEESHDD